MSEEPAHYIGHRDRLRKRFLEVGDEALADYELIELILFRAIPRRDVKPIAKDLIKRFGSFAEVVAAPLARLREVEGVSEGVATEFKVIEASARRFAKGQIKKRTTLAGSMMPEGLVDNLGIDDFGSLLAYLQSLR